jgi:hypothetical protein
MVVRLLAAFVVAFAALVAPADARDVDSILTSTKLAAGGDAWNDVKVLRYTFRLRQSELEGSGETLIDVVGGRFVTRFRLGPMRGAEGFDGERAWTQDDAGLVTIAGSLELRGRAISTRYRNALAYWFPERGRAQLSERMQLFRVRIKEIVTVRPEGGLPFDLWFDAQTKQLERIVEDGATETQTTMLDEYRGVGPLVIAHRIRTSNAAAGFGAERRITKVEINPVISDAAYTMPAPPPPDFTFAGGRRPAVLPFRFINNHVYVDAKLNGRVFSMLVDTGAANVITPTTAKALGLAAVGAARMKGTGEGSEDAAFTRIASMRLGHVNVRNQLFAVVPLEKFGEVEGVPFHGIIGYELFKRFTVRIDYQARTLTITDPRVWRHDGRGVAVPIVFNGSAPEVEGSIDGVAGSFDIDTGSRVSVGLNSPFVQRHALRAQFKPSIEAVTGWGVGGATRGTVARARRLMLGRLSVDNVVVDMSLHKHGALSHAAPAGNIGSGVLKRFTVTFDYTGGRIFFEPNARNSAGDPYDRSGIWINAGSSGYRVDGVVTGSPAALAGIEVDDVIVAVDGRPASALALTDLRDLLRDSAPGTIVKLTIRSKGRLTDVQLRLRDQI